MEVYIDTGDAESNKGLFDELFRQRDGIEAAVGGKLEWDRLDRKRACRISLYFHDGIRISDEDRWPEAREWIISALGKMRDAFTPELDALD